MMKKSCGSKKKNYMGGGMVSPRKAYAMGGEVEITPRQAMQIGRKAAGMMAQQMQPQRMVRKFRTM